MKWNQLLALAITASLMSVPHAHAQPPAAAPAQAGTAIWTIDAKNSQANFQVRHLSVNTVRGSISGIKGNVIINDKDITKSSVDATLVAATVNTANQIRDNDLKSDKYFNVDKFPGIYFKSTSITRVNGQLKMTGDLTLCDVTRSVTLDLDGPAQPVTNPKTGDMVSGFSATGTIKRSDFNFGMKSPGSVAIGDEIKFTLDIEMDKKAS
jgi:polyisoprenoid-binding protein YceI